METDSKLIIGTPNS